MNIQHPSSNAEYRASVHVYVNCEASMSHAHLPPIVTFHVRPRDLITSPDSAESAIQSTQVLLDIEVAHQSDSRFQRCPFHSYETWDAVPGSEMSAAPSALKQTVSQKTRFGRRRNLKNHRLSSISFGCVTERWSKSEHVASGRESMNIADLP